MCRFGHKVKDHGDGQNECKGHCDGKGVIAECECAEKEWADSERKRVSEGLQTAGIVFLVLTGFLLCCTCYMCCSMQKSWHKTAGDGRSNLQNVNTIGMQQHGNNNANMMYQQPGMMMPAGNMMQQQQQQQMMMMPNSNMMMQQPGTMVVQQPVMMQNGNMMMQNGNMMMQQQQPNTSNTMMMGQTAEGATIMLL